MVMRALQTYTLGNGLAQVAYPPPRKRLVEPGGGTGISIPRGCGPGSGAEYAAPAGPRAAANASSTAGTVAVRERRNLMHWPPLRMVRVARDSTPRTARAARAVAGIP